MSVEKIELLVEDGLVDEVVTRVKTGKEAEVFVVRKGEEYLAAKVYKDRIERNFRNNAGYREGRAVRNSRDARAMAKGSKYGVAKAEDEWMHTEHDALQVLLDAGVRVPKPELFYEGVLLMELVLGPDGHPAPRLIDCALTEDEALAIHRELIDFIVRMTLADRIHGDLSPFNILLAWNGPTIIDFPQVVAAAHNPQADKFLIRDVKIVTEHLARFAPRLKARVNDGLRIFNAYEKRELAIGFRPEDHPELERHRVGVEAGHRGFRARTEFRPKDPARPPGARPGGPRPPATGATPNRPPPPHARPTTPNARPGAPAKDTRPAQSNPPRESRPASGARPPSPGQVATGTHGNGKPANGQRPNHPRANRPPRRSPDVVRIGSPQSKDAPASTTTPAGSGAPRPGGPRPNDRHRFRNQRRP